MSNTDKQRYFLILTHFMPLISFDTPWKHQKASGYQEINRGSSNVLDVRTKSILAFIICKLTSLENLELPNSK